MTLKRYVPLKRTGWPRRHRRQAKPVHDLATGRSFDSTGEAKYYGILELRQRAGEIRDLQHHVKVVLIPGRPGAPEVSWEVDYRYEEDGRWVWCDYKPPEKYRTKAGRLRSMWDGKDYLLLKLWKHFGPGLLLVVSNRGTEKTVMPAI